MTMPRDDQSRAEAEEPLDPEIEAVRRRLIRFMIINLVVVFGLVLIVIAVLVYRQIGSDETPPAAVSSEVPSSSGSSEPARFTIDAGEVLVGQSFEGGTVSLVLERPDGTQRIVIVEIGTGRTLQELIISAP